MTRSIVPGNARTVAPTTTLMGLFSAMESGDAAALAPYLEGAAEFAVNPVNDAGPAGATIGGDTGQVGYLGELWRRAAYQRRITPLVNNATLDSYRMKGWRWTADVVMGDYAGNGAEVASGALDTEPVDVEAKRLAVGHKIDRRYRDFGDSPVLASYLINQAEAYKRATDARLLAYMLAQATATAAGAVPTGIAKGLGAIVDGALDIITSENRPSFALVAPALWREIVLTPKDQVLGFLSAGFGLEEGDLEGFKILPANTGGNKVLVGAKESTKFWELGGESPIRVDGVAVHNGADDLAAFGYYAHLTEAPDALRIVTVA